MVFIIEKLIQAVVYNSIGRIPDNVYFRLGYIYGKAAAVLFVIGNVRYAEVIGICARIAHLRHFGGISTIFTRGAVFDSIIIIFYLGFATVVTVIKPTVYGYVCKRVMAFGIICAAVASGSHLKRCRCYRKVCACAHRSIVGCFGYGCHNNIITDSCGTGSRTVFKFGIGRKIICISNICRLNLIGKRIKINDRRRIFLLVERTELPTCNIDFKCVLRFGYAIPHCNGNPVSTYGIIDIRELSPFVVFGMQQSEIYVICAKI